YLPLNSSRYLILLLIGQPEFIIIWAVNCGLMIKNVSHSVKIMIKTTLSLSHPLELLSSGTKAKKKNNK
ncbi:MAG: hypothetical protein ACP5KG_07580, partial [Myxococcota bacterium]